MFKGRNFYIIHICYNFSINAINSTINSYKVTLTKILIALSKLNSIA